jgi:hypothetical protein
MPRTLRTGRLLICGILAMSTLGCKALKALPPVSSGPTSPTPVPSEPVVNIAGNWVGTFESANLGTQTIAMVVVQLANCVDGSWKSSTNEWSGAISGFAERDSYSGQMSLERPGSTASGGCLAIGNISGEVGSDTLRWTSTGVTPRGQCIGDLPQSIIITMRRQ